MRIGLVGCSRDAVQVRRRRRRHKSGSMIWHSLARLCTAAAAANSCVNKVATSKSQANDVLCAWVYFDSIKQSFVPLRSTGIG